MVANFGGSAFYANVQYSKDCERCDIALNTILLGEGCGQNRHPPIFGDGDLERVDYFSPASGVLLTMTGLSGTL